MNHLSRSARSPSRRPLCAAAVAVALALAACGPADPPPAVPKVTPPPDPALTASAAPEPTVAPVTSPSPLPTPKRAALRFEVGGMDFSSPLVDVLVNGQPTTVILDTGATHHVLASWVASQIGPTKTGKDVGVDHTGKVVSLALLADAQLTISGWGSLGKADLLVVNLPAPLQRAGIGGVVSPQDLLTEGRALVLDFRKLTMLETSVEEASKSLESAPGESISGEIRDCGNGGTLPFAHATIGGVEVDAQLDTGASSTTVRAASDVGLRLAPKAKTSNTAIAASGAFTVPSVGGAHVKIGALDVTTSVDVVKRDPQTKCSNDAFVGMDVLRQCRLVLTPKTLAGKCVAPAP